MTGISYTIVFLDGEAWVMTFAQHPVPGDLVATERGPYRVAEVSSPLHTPRPFVKVIEPGRG